MKKKKREWGPPNLNITWTLKAFNKITLSPLVTFYSIYRIHLPLKFSDLFPPFFPFLWSWLAQCNMRNFTCNFMLNNSNYFFKGEFLLFRGGEILNFDRYFPRKRKSLRPPVSWFNFNLDLVASASHPRPRAPASCLPASCSRNRRDPYCRRTALPKVTGKPCAKNAGVLGLVWWPPDPSRQEPASGSHPTLLTTTPPKIAADKPHAQESWCGRTSGLDPASSNLKVAGNHLPVGTGFRATPLSSVFLVSHTCDLFPPVLVILSYVHAWFSRIVSNC